MKKFSRREFMEAITTCTAKLSFPLVAGSAVSSCTTVGREVMSLLNWGVGRTQVPEGRSPMEQVVSNIRSRVAIISSADSVTGDGKVNSTVVRNMIKKGIRALGETSHVEEG